MKINYRIFLKHCIVLMGFLLTGTFSMAQSKDSLAVMNAANKFISAFNHFKWKPFRESFTRDATIFFPEWDYASRVSGKESINKTWLELFPEFTNNPENDSLSISPKNISIQLHGKTAIMTFHLGNGVERLARRTIVWIKQEGEWKIAHLHASVLKK